MNKKLLALGILLISLMPLPAEEFPPASTLADYATQKGLLDLEADGREYLRDIRQILCWLVALGLFNITKQAFDFRR